MEEEQEEGRVGFGKGEFVDVKIVANPKAFR